MHKLQQFFKMQIFSKKERFPHCSGQHYRPIYIKLSRSVRTAEKLFDEWTATVRFQFWFTESALLRAKEISYCRSCIYWPVPFPFSAISRRPFTVCNDMDSRLPFLNML